ncbi:MAG: hypothetical protein HYV75_01960 [Opitutae bacterium]|nr:hypothetical protein [Opitutae bacterium]
MKTAVIDRRYKWGETARRLLLGAGGLQAGIAALVVGDAAFLFDVFVGLLTHGLVV